MVHFWIYFQIDVKLEYSCRDTFFENSQWSNIYFLEFFHATEKAKLDVLFSFYFSKGLEIIADCFREINRSLYSFYYAIKKLMFNT